MYTGMIEMNLPIFFKSKQERKVAEGYADVRSVQANTTALKMKSFT